MTAEHGYCSKCGTPLEVDFHSKWVENTSALGPAGEWIDEIYCPRCREEEESEKRARIQELERTKKEKERKEREKREAEKRKRLEKYKKYMPKKVTAIVLTYQEAKHLYDLIHKETIDFYKENEINKDEVYIDNVLLEKLLKAVNETNYSLTEADKFAKEKGWEKE